jgi:hypothetical protein
MNASKHFDFDNSYDSQNYGKKPSHSVSQLNNG